MKHSFPAVTTIGAEAVQTTVEEEEAVFSTVEVEDPMVDSTIVGLIEESETEVNQHDQHRIGSWVPATTAIMSVIEQTTQLLQSMRSCQVGLNSVHFKTLKTAKIVLTFLLISQE
jgi:hypothetical protein